jgi:hypothetical protein
MAVIHSVSIFFDEGQKVEIEEDFSPGDAWPLNLALFAKGSYVHLHFSEIQFIKFKNSILSLDRQIEEERRCQNLHEI